MKVFVSDELESKIDPEQFYTNPDSQNITCSLWIDDGPIVVKIDNFKIANNKIEIEFVCPPDTLFSFLETKSIKNVTFYKEKEKTAALEFQDLNIIAKSFKFSSAGMHLCNLKALLDNK